MWVCGACVGSGVLMISTMHVVGWGGAGQNESGGVKQWSGHFYLDVLS